jgi:uncharacterized protein YbaR (Trm112 family)
MALDNELLRILACPACRGSLEPDGEGEGLVCAACALVYPVREDIPVMLAEEAVPLNLWRSGTREVPASRLPGAGKG